MDEAIVNYMKRKYSLMIGEAYGQRALKCRWGQAYALAQETKVEVKGARYGCWCSEND